MPLCRSQDKPIHMITAKNVDKVNVTNRPWMEIGAELDPVLARTSKSGVADVLQEASQRYGVAARTLQNICKAYRYVKSHAKSVGMSMHDIKAAAMSIDVLIRIHKKSPQTAFDVRKEVFEGRYSYRYMLELEKEIDKKNARPVFEQIDWNAFAEEFVNDYFAGGELTMVFRPDRGRYSGIANLLGIDLELSHRNKTACLFLTPRVAFSAHRGQEIENQIPKVFASAGFYDRVMYLLWDDEEIDVVNRYASMSMDEKIKSIELLPRYDVDAYKCFGDEILSSGYDRTDI